MRLYLAFSASAADLLSERATSSDTDALAWVLGVRGLAVGAVAVVDSVVGV